MRFPILAALCVVLSGCVTNGETVAFRSTNPNQQTMMRDGQPALVSRQKNSIVLVRPASRQMQAGGRPVFVVGINNMSKAPMDFRVADVEANQIVGEQQYPMQVVTYETLVSEEHNRQVAAAIFTGLAVAGNAMSASQAGRGSYSATTIGPHGGMYQTTGNFYSPTANAIAVGNANAQNEVLVASTIERGQQNMAQLEKTVIKDNTLMPGEWYGGALYLSPPGTPPGSAAKFYSIVITVGSDRHVIEVSQVPTGT